MMLQLRQGEVLVNYLPHLERRLHVERHLGDYPDRPDPPPRRKSVTVLFAGESDHLPISRDDFHPGYGG